MGFRARNVGKIVGLVKAIQQEFRGLHVGQLMGADRREAPRVRSFDLVKWIPNDEVMNHRISNANDISATGLSFNTREYLTPDSVLRLIVNIAEHNRQVPVLAKVVWSRLVGDQNFQAGVHFEEISEQDRELIKSLTMWSTPIHD